jgi:hypothetical protein
VEKLYFRVSTSKQKWRPSYKRRYMLAVVNLEAAGSNGNKWEQPNQLWQKHARKMQRKWQATQREVKTVVKQEWRGGVGFRSFQGRKMKSWPFISYLARLNQRVPHRNPNVVSTRLLYDWYTTTLWLIYDYSMTNLQLFYGWSITTNCKVMIVAWLHFFICQPRMHGKITC